MACFSSNTVIAFRTFAAVRPASGFQKVLLISQGDIGSTCSSMSDQSLGNSRFTITQGKYYKRFPSKKRGRHRTHKTEPHRLLGLGVVAAWYLRATTTGCRLRQVNLEKFYRKRLWAHRFHENLEPPNGEQQP